MHFSQPLVSICTSPHMKYHWLSVLASVADKSLENIFDFFNDVIFPCGRGGRVAGGGGGAGSSTGFRAAGLTVSSSKLFMVGGPVNCGSWRL